MPTNMIYPGQLKTSIPQGICEKQLLVPTPRIWRDRRTHLAHIVPVDAEIGILVYLVGIERLADSDWSNCRI